MGLFAKKCALALASLDAFMLSAYLDFIDIANFIFLMVGGMGGGPENSATPRRRATEIRGRMWSTIESVRYPPSYGQLENQRINAAGV